MQQRDEFDGMVAMVCGGSTGIGRACSLRLAAGGASVAVVARRQEPIDEVVAAINQDGGRAIGIKADVSIDAEVKAAVQWVVAELGGIDVLVNSQGIQRYGTVEETDETLWDEVMNVNTKSMYLTARYAIPEMRKRGKGSIVNVGSVQGLATQTSVAAYSTSKAANIGLTKTIAVDYAAEGIRANIVLPASIDTPMLRTSADLFRGDTPNDELIHNWGHMHPVGRVGTPEEVAELVAFLAGPRSSFITGAEIKVDGGMMAALGVVLPD
jgi:NAD(P)-dependent dehydrogenase (short-subunit alcohol dehydrogenase family)